MLKTVIAATALLLCTVGVGQAWAAEAPVKVDSARMNNADRDAANWLSYGRTYSEQRFSPLSKITTDNAKQLGLAWFADLDTNRGQQATPLVIDGVMYVSTAWSMVKAYDAATGKLLWSYDPQVPRELGVKGCCDVVNRGVAAWKGKIYVGTFDGRLVALDAKTGKPAWSVVTGDQKNLTITGAPRVVKGRVIIGMSGGEYGIRGYISAYDAETGKLAWRFYTVPGDPSKPFENKAMEMAAKTWSGEWWKLGGGGTTWDAISYDPDLNLVYFGAGNGIEWARNYRTKSKGDNLFTSSIVALNADTGKYVWHYQETPGDNWDFTSTQPMILADINIDNAPRKVILHAPKNGFFFVIDRTNGKFISAKNFVDVNWATGYDANGRPIEVAEARSPDKPFDTIPGPYGAHNWHSMSFNPRTGLVYLPAQSVPVNLMDNKDWKMNGNKPGEPHGGLGWNVAMFANVVPPKGTPFGRLIAWDPVQQKEAWRHEHISPWNGGTLTTAGNLVFQGTADGRFMVFNARTGEPLWESPTGTGVVAAPVTYMVDGKQYVSIAVGWGGVYGLYKRATERQGPGTVYTFAVGGAAAPPEFVKYRMDALVSGVKYDPAHVKEGTLLYVSNCVFCHGVPGVDRGGNIPNLAYMNAAYIENLDKFVFKGAATERGMPDYTGKLSAEDVEKIKAFIQGTADAIRPKP